MGAALRSAGWSWLVSVNVRAVVATVVASMASGGSRAVCGKQLEARSTGARCPGDGLATPLVIAAIVGRRR